MRVLFDHGTPRGLIRTLPGHTITTAQAEGWDKLDNGALLDAAERAGMDLLLTTDRRIRYQQNLASRKIAIVVLSGTTKWSLGQAVYATDSRRSSCGAARQLRGNRHSIRLIARPDAGGAARPMQASGNRTDA